MQRFLKDLVFIGIFLILFYFCSHIFVLKGNTYGSDVTSFYNLPKNSLDLIFFGSSHSYATFSPDVIEKESNLQSYNFATQQQPIYITYHYMVEALKTQKPQYFVLETRMLAVNEDYAAEGTIRDAIDKMHFSKNKIEAINVSVPPQSDKMSYYINLIKYHSRYASLTFTDIKMGLLNEGINNRGFKNLSSNSQITIDNSEVLKNKEVKEISAKNLEYFNKIIELCNKNNIELILVKSPCLLTIDDQKYYNWVKEYTSQNNIIYIDYNEKVKELNIEEGDYYDIGHLSETGAIKVSMDFAKFINNLNK